jgi:hypothetical protein
MNAGHWAVIHKEIISANQSAFKEGLAVGLAVAERMYGIYEANPILQKPHSEEKMLGWFKQFIEEARAVDYSSFVPEKT